MAAERSKILGWNVPDLPTWSFHGSRTTKTTLPPVHYLKFQFFPLGKDQIQTAPPGHFSLLSGGSRKSDRDVSISAKLVRTYAADIQIGIPEPGPTRADIMNPSTKTSCGRMHDYCKLCEMGGAFSVLEQSTHAYESWITFFPFSSFDFFQLKEIDRCAQTAPTAAMRTTGQRAHPTSTLYHIHESMSTD